MGFIINHKIVIVTVITQVGKYREKLHELIVESTISLFIRG